MNGIAEVIEHYKVATQTYLEHKSTRDSPAGLNFFLGRISGFEDSLSCLGVSNDEISEIHYTCEEEFRNEQEQEAGA